MIGFVKIYRDILVHRYFKNEKAFKVMVYCLLKASHKEHKVMIGRQSISLKKGQFVFGRKKAAIELNMAETTIRDYINYLKEDGFIDVKATNKYSIVTIINWEIYQANDNDTTNKWTTNEQQIDNNTPTNGQQMDTYKNVKNDKNDKELCKQHGYSIDIVPIEYSNNMDTRPQKEKEKEEEKEEEEKEMDSVVTEINECFSIINVNNNSKNSCKSTQSKVKGNIKENNNKNMVIDVDSIWQLYPNKKGKATAIKKIPKLIDQYGYEQIERCVQRYTEEVKVKKVDKQYIKHGSTFFNNGYIDYLDENYIIEEEEDWRLTDEDIENEQKLNKPKEDWML